ncbi:hypothetical protein TSAR_008473, partial [Trichomalopsis sarcophagae]
MEPNLKNLDEEGRGSEAEGYRAAPPSQLEVEHPTAKPEGKSVKGNTAYNTLTRWITGAASTSKNLNSAPAGDSSQNRTEVVAGGSSGEPSRNPEPSQGGQVGMGVDLQRPPAGANTRTAASTSKNLNSDPAGASTAGDSSQNPTEVVAGGSSGEPSGNPEPSQGGQVGMG